MKKEEMLAINNIDEVVLKLFEVPLDDKPIIMDHVRDELRKFCLIEDNTVIMSIITDVSVAKVMQLRQRKLMSDSDFKIASAMAAGFMFGYLYRMKEMRSS